MLSLQGLGDFSLGLQCLYKRVILSFWLPALAIFPHFKGLVRNSSKLIFGWFGWISWTLNSSTFTFRGRGDWGCWSTWGIDHGRCWNLWKWGDSTWGWDWSWGWKLHFGRAIWSWKLHFGRDFIIKYNFWWTINCQFRAIKLYFGRSIIFLGNNCLRISWGGPGMGSRSPLFRWWGSWSWIRIQENQLDFQRTHKWLLLLIQKRWLVYSCLIRNDRDFLKQLQLSWNKSFNWIHVSGKRLRSGHQQVLEVKQACQPDDVRPMLQ